MYISIPTELIPYWTKPQKMKKILHAEPAGNTVQFKCLAGGDDPITVKWYREKNSKDQSASDDTKGPLELLSKDKRVGGFKVSALVYVKTWSSILSKVENT